jgi:two-component system, NtrC family, response regulator HydG
VLSDGGRLQPEWLKLESPKIAQRGAKAAAPTDVRGMIQSLVRFGIQQPMEPGVKLYDYLVGGLERELIEQVMAHCRDVKITAADRLGINRNTLHKKLEEFAVADHTTKTNE